MTSKQSDVLIDILGKVLFSFYSKERAPTINTLLSEFEKEIKDPAILADKY